MTNSILVWQYSMYYCYFFFKKVSFFQYCRNEMICFPIFVLQRDVRNINKLTLNP